ncbi:MAG: ABC transporter ATP-binding protein [Nitrococcus sp.]|nr:ABC transporter ATP-binding protein [Nitrococcus sp.]
MTYVLDNLTVKQGGEVHLDGLSLTLPSSGVVTVIGRTQAGKTTLLKVLAGLIAPSSGSLTSGGENLLKIPAWRRRVGMVYQQFVNYPHLTVRDNITFPLKRRGMTKAAMEEKLTYVTELLGLAAFLDRRPAELSGGQQQRVALARSLVKDTEVLLLDEPLVNLDYKLREQLRDEFRRIFHASDNRLVVYATTEPLEAMIMQGQVVVLHEGRVVQAGDYREVYSRPANTMAATIFNDPPMNLFDARIGNGQVQFGPDTALALPAHFAALPSGDYIVGIRASEATLGDEVPARVALAEINGSTTVLHLDLPFGSLVLERDGVDPHAIGEQVRINLPTERFFAFDTKTRNLAAAPAGD